MENTATLKVRFNFPNEPIDEKLVSVRAWKALAMAGIRDTDTLIEKYPELPTMYMRNFGKTSFTRVTAYLVDRQVEYIAKSKGLSREEAELCFLADLAAANA